jgi:hypothetical protein
MRREQTEMTFEENAEREINDVLSFGPTQPDDDKATWYAALFLIDYQVALNSPQTCADYFLAAYANRGLAVRYCKPEEQAARRESLDVEAFRLRQQWRAGKGADVSAPSQ